MKPSTALFALLVVIAWAIDLRNALVQKRVVYRVLFAILTLYLGYSVVVRSADRDAAALRSIKIGSSKLLLIGRIEEHLFVCNPATGETSNITVPTSIVFLGLKSLNAKPCWKEDTR